jgi:hypothetical protein
MRIALLAALLSLLAIGCTTTSTVIEQTIRPRASYDLDCPISEVEVSLMSGGIWEGTYGARGCGRRVSYDAMCSPAGTHCDVERASNVE